MSSMPQTGSRSMRPSRRKWFQVLPGREAQLRDNKRSPADITEPSSWARLLRRSGQEMAMKLREVMSTDVEVVGPEATLAEAAEAMRQLNVGILPVCDGDTLLGVLTDRDITIRGVAAGADPNRMTVQQA